MRSCNELIARAKEAGFNLRALPDGGVAVSLDETVTREELGRLADVFGAALDDTKGALPIALLRNSPILTEPVFTAHHAEHAKCCATSSGWRTRTSR